MQIQENIPLAPFTTWKIGGPASYFTRVKNVDDVSDAIAWAKKSNQKYFVLGGGSNILVSDSGFDGLVIKIELDYVNQSDSQITAGAGVAMSRLAAMTMQKNLAGLEWAIGIPGTVGGAVFGNSNCFGGSTGQNIKSVKLLDAFGNIREENKDYFEFDYDYSKLQKTGEIALAASFSSHKGPAETKT